MGWPAVAVIIPTLNEEKYISSCLDSVTGQDYDFELLDVMVVDGGSCDKTQAIVEAYAARYANIRWIVNPARIQAAAFNIGVSNSFAPVIIRLDAHACYAPEYISTCVRLLEGLPGIGNVGGVWQVRAGVPTRMAKANAVLNQTSFGIGGAKFRVGAKAGPADTVPFGAFPRKVVVEVGGMNEHLARGEDNEYNARIRAAGYMVWFDPKIVSTYFARPTLRASVIQMYRNGRSIGYLLRSHPKAVGMRHMAPVLFVLGISVSLLAGWWVMPLWYLLWGAMLLYFLVDLAATILACRKFGCDIFFILPILYFLVHVSYGIGTICGYTTKKIQ